MRVVFPILALALMSTAIAAAPDFARDVRPILVRSCVGCHGPEKPKSGYRLDSRETAMRGGESGHAAILPHQAGVSPLILRVTSADETLQMPPPASDGPRLTAREVQTLRDWIDAGPVWPDEFAGAAGAQPHWSWQPLTRPVVPGGGGHPIDAFIRSKLAEKKLTPSPAADRRTLLRRLSYDLTGLPPTPEEMAGFIADPDGLAYEKKVNQLLESPRYGERWARHWFDTIHFADSHGYEHDVGRDHAWRFRDYVIAAFNRDTPWPRFIREQLAADVFYPDEPRLTAALGYLGAGTFDLSTYTTGPVTFDYLDRDDLVTQTMAAFASTTANCARCHAHKFDPIPQEDYYALQAVFAGVLKGDVAYDEDPAVGRERHRWTSLLTAVAKRDAAVLLSTDHAAMTERWLSTLRRRVDWHPLRAETFLATEGSVLTRSTNGVFVSGGVRPDKDTYVITGTTGLTHCTALRLELLADESLPMRGPGRNENGNLHLSELELRVFETGASNSRPVTLRRATADFNQKDWGVERALDGDLKTAWGIYPAVGESHQAVFELAEPLSLVPDARLAVVLRQAHGGGHLIGAFRLALTSDPAADAAARPGEVDSALAVALARRTEAQRLAIAAYALRIRANEALAALPKQALVFAASSSVTLVDGNLPGQLRTLPEPKVVHVLNRGDFDKPGVVATPGALSALTHLPARFGLPNPADEGARRAALADWLAHPGNGLTWRSIVNRTWHYHFGRGLCDTPSDLGTKGGAPSHPELIDWLAVWFRDDARGSLKELHRLIVTSATYRQSSQHREEAARLDGDNRLWWRQNRPRLDADAFRDFTLAAAGALDLKMGGPAIQYFRKSKGPQLTPALDYGAYDWSRPESGRRSIYRYVWRAIADPFMEALDFPDLGLPAPVRGFSVSSLQALTLYNNDFVLHQSGTLARQVQSEAGTLEAQVGRCTQRVWLREPSAAEAQELTGLARAGGLPALARVLFNSNEFLFIE